MVLCGSWPLVQDSNSFLPREASPRGSHLLAYLLFLQIDPPTPHPVASRDLHWVPWRVSRVAVPGPPAPSAGSHGALNTAHICPSMVLPRLTPTPGLPSLLGSRGRLPAPPPTDLLELQASPVPLPAGPKPLSPPSFPAGRADTWPQSGLQCLSRDRDLSAGLSHPLCPRLRSKCHVSPHSDIQRLRGRRGRLPGMGA